MEWFKSELNSRLGWSLDAPHDFGFESTTDRYGWNQDPDGKWNFGLFVEGGRLRSKARSALCKIASSVDCQFRLTANQNLVIARIDEEAKSLVQDAFHEFGVDDPSSYSALRLNSIACTALPTCSLALAESERYLPTLIDELDNIIERFDLRDESIAIRSTGCPNGCGRPYLGEIGLVGKSPGKYNLYLGAGFDGMRLNKLFKQAITHDEIIATLEPILESYSNDRHDNEKFGDFCIRKQLVKSTNAGSDFHE